MKGFTLLLASLALWFNPAESLSCFFCPNQTNAINCTRIKECPVGQTICKTTEYSARNENPYLVIKDCAVSCIRNNSNNDNPIFCCTSDYCNTRGLYGICSGTVNYRQGFLMFFISVAAALIGSPPL
ncbi:ly6/PLAUR domain-containing protein 2-like [Pelobates fuscus]|uniref:ly6/PLAUR domain-containing protein 2-like n=1 Tax=Pelobates fuscus TaxID=191477 RepID=UPI002FE4E6F7